MAGRALLMGVPEYTNDAIPDLGFVANDLTSLSASLTNIGYEITQLGGAGKDSPTHNAIIHGINEFCRHEAQENEVAIIYFSGHGLHHKGRDYLVPGDATLGDEIIEQVMVPLDFAAACEQSRASAIFFFIDACREGVDLGEKATYQQWSEGKREQVGNQRSAYVFACGPGEVSRYVSGAEGFSLFSRALSDTLNTNSALGMTFSRVRTEVQKRVDELADKYQKKRQHIRVVSEEGAIDGALGAIRISAGGLGSGSIQPDRPSVDVEAIGKLTITSEDLRLLSYNHDEKSPWVEGSLSVIHVLRSASALDKPVKWVLDRLGEFEPVGIKVPEIDIEAASQIDIDRDDLVLLPSGGEADRLAAVPADLSAVQILYAASKLSKPVDKILERLRRFEAVGVKLPEIDPAQVKGLMVDGRDLTMLSVDLDARAPWLQGEVPVTHVLQASKQLEETVGSVVERLASFEPCGITIPRHIDASMAHLTVTEDDLRLLSQTLSGFPWVESPIPIGHVMYVANEDDLTIGEVLERLRRFEPAGFVCPEVDAATAELTVPDADLTLVSQDFDGIAPWLSGEIPAARLLLASNKFEEPVGKVCERIERYEGGGWRHPEVDEQAVAGIAVSDRDMVLLAGSEEWNPNTWLEDTIPIAHILYAANRFDESVAEIAARAVRLKAVGIAVPEIDQEIAEGQHVSDNDVQLLSSGFNSLGPWVDGEVSRFHLLRAANVQEQPLDQILTRMKKFEVFGYTVPPVDLDAIAGLEVSAQDLTALSRDLDGLAPWVGDDSITLIHLVRAAYKLEESVGDIVERLEKFVAVGIEPLGIEDPEILSLEASYDDLIVLSQDMDAAAPWMEGAIPIGHVLFAAGERNEEVGQVLSRLSRFVGLGITLPEVSERGLEMHVSREDLLLMSRDLDAHPPWFGRDIPVVQLLRAAKSLEEPVGLTVQRLQKLESAGFVNLTPFFDEPSSSSWRRSRSYF